MFVLLHLFFRQCFWHHALLIMILINLNFVRSLSSCSVINCESFGTDLVRIQHKLYKSKLLWVVVSIQFPLFIVSLWKNIFVLLNEFKAKEIMKNTVYKPESAVESTWCLYKKSTIDPPLILAFNNSDEFSVLADYRPCVWIITREDF